MTSQPEKDCGGLDGPGMATRARSQQPVISNDKDIVKPSSPEKERGKGNIQPISPEKERGKRNKKNNQNSLSTSLEKDR